MLELFTVPYLYIKSIDQPIVALDWSDGPPYTLSHLENDRDVTQRVMDKRCRTHHLCVNPGIPF